MAKNIVICCDGTGNEYGDDNSNVVQLYRALVIDGKRQVGYYHPGVGTEGSPTSNNKVSAALSVVGGLAFGAGFLRYVGDAYRYLMNTYQDGDNVYLFGFSRGAYTARALAGVLHMFGLLCPGNEGLIPYVVKMYAKRSRKAGGMTHTFDVATGFKATFCRPCPLHLVGLWDTVSSVGWIWDPLKLPFTARNPDMAHGRHAVSIDERRCYFRNNLWGAPFPDQDIKQVWFSGVHSDIGGSYPSAESGLSQITLQWMLCEAVSLGLLVNPDEANEILGRVPTSPGVAPNPAQREHNSLTLPWWFLEVFPHSYYDFVLKKKKWRIPFGASRVIPPGSSFHESVWKKLAADATYRPKNLPSDWTTNPDWKSNAEPDNTCDFTALVEAGSSPPADSLTWLLKDQDFQYLSQSLAAPDWPEDGIRISNLRVPEPDAPSALANRSDNASLMRVFYATDRLQIQEGSDSPQFGFERSVAGKIQYGECAISIPKIHKTGKLESPSLLKLEFRFDPAKHIVLTQTLGLEEARFFEEVSQSVAASVRKESFVFVHGYNVSFEDAARRTGQIAFDLHFVGAPIFYSWPSNGKLVDYLVDETNISWSAPHFQAFLSLLAQRSGAERIHIIAHSMGNRAVCEALKNLSYQPDSQIRLNHLVLAAPDIDAQTFAELANTLQRLSERVTLYESRNDKALEASKKIHGYARAGSPLLIIPGIDTIDASAVDTDFLGHSYFSDTWPLLSDIHSLIAKDDPPPRFGLTAMEGGTYYAFR